MSSEYAPGGGYGNEGYGEPYAAPKNGAGVAGLVLGIVALLLLFTVIGAPVSLLLAVIGLIASIIGFRRVGRRRATNRGVALTGLVLNVLALLVSAVITAFLVAGLAYVLNNGGGEAWDCLLEANGDQAATQQCVDRLNEQNGVQSLPAVP
ncbi:hypothetical protein [Kineococcus sp. SYSU DK003]|uniref:hypothetical protein n=1 Tax=Kineococcus sp. SYSU DK003 TaxID=3383124 RepID=UPI003D7D1723